MADAGKISLVNMLGESILIFDRIPNDLDSSATFSKHHGIAYPILWYQWKGMCGAKFRLHPRRDVQQDEFTIKSARKYLWLVTPPVTVGLSFCPAAFHFDSL